MRDHVLPIVTRASADYENARWLAQRKATETAGVAQQQSAGAPCQGRGFDSRRPIHPPTEGAR